MPHCCASRNPGLFPPKRESGLLPPRPTSRQYGVDFLDSRLRGNDTLGLDSRLRGNETLGLGLWNRPLSSSER